jgi:hypothetical protein
MVDELTVSDAAGWFCALPKTDRARFMAWLAHNLTVAARSYYELQAPGLTDPARFRAFNEILHRVTACLGHILSGGEDMGWAPIVVQEVLEPTDRQVANHTRQAWAWTRRSFNGVR